MSLIRLTPDMMRLRAKEYRNESHKMDEVVKKLNTLLLSLQSEWDGKSAVAFQNQYESLKPSLNQMVNLIESIATQLTQTANSIEALDQEIANRLR